MEDFESFQSSNKEESKDITEKGLRNSRQSMEYRQNLNEARLTQEERVAYEKYLKNLEDLSEKSFWEFFKASAINQKIYTPEEEELIASANAKLSNIKKREEGLFSEEREILSEILKNPEERQKKFEEAELLPEEQEAYEEYLKDREELLKRLSTRWGFIKTRLNPFASESLPNYTPEKNKLIQSVEKKLIDIERGKKEYSI